MTQFENPNIGRAEIYEAPDLFQVRLKSDPNHFVSVFLMIWLCGWAYGEFMALNILTSGQSDGVDLFLLIWLGGWTIGGLVAAVHLLWILFGYELLSLSQNALTIQRCIPFYQRTTHYDVKHIANMRVSPAAADESFIGRRHHHPGFFSGSTKGTLKFDYGLKTASFGLEMEEAEARDLVDRLSAKLKLR